MNTTEKIKKELAATEKKAEQLKQKLKQEQEKSKITNRVISFVTACKEIKKDPKKVIPKGVPKHIEALMMMEIFVEALNEGWFADYDNNEEKWYIWWRRNKTRPAGFGFVRVGTVDDYAGTGVGPRLSFRTKELAEHAGRNPEYVKLLNIYYSKNK